MKTNKLFFNYIFFLVKFKTLYLANFNKNQIYNRIEESL